MPRSFAPSRSCSARWPLTLRSAGSSTPWVRIRRRWSPESPGLAPRARHARVGQRGARARARATVCGHPSPVPRADPVIIDLDATPITAYSEKEGATPNFKHGFGFHPLLAFVDHGDGGTGEPLVGMLRPGRATANTAADQIAVLDAALAQLPEPLRSRVLVRGDSGSGVQPLLWHVHDL